MRDKIGEHEERMEVIFFRIKCLEEKLEMIMDRINWLENPKSAPKAPKPNKIEEPEGKL